MCFNCYERLKAKAITNRNTETVKKKRTKARKSSGNGLRAKAIENHHTETVKKKRRKARKSSANDDGSDNSSASPSVEAVVDHTKTNPDTQAKVLPSKIIEKRKDKKRQNNRYLQRGSRTIKLDGAAGDIPNSSLSESEEEKDRDASSTGKRKTVKNQKPGRKKGVPGKDSDSASSSSASSTGKGKTLKNQKPGRKKGVPGNDSDSSSSSNSSDDKNEKDHKGARTNKDRPSKKKKKKTFNMNSLFLGTHSLAVRFATLDASECATKEAWIDSDGQTRKRIRQKKEDDKKLDWLVNMKNKDIPLDERPSYKAGSGGVTSFGQKAITTDTVFARPEGILANYGKRRLGEVCLYGPSYAMADLWLKDQIKELHVKICQSRRKKNTRATADDLRVGNDLDIASSYIPADSVINMVDDDVELVHYSTATKGHCYLWHSGRFYEDGMLIRAIKAVLENSNNGIIPVPKEFHRKTEFLGFTEVYRDRNHNIIAFNITAMLLFRHEDKSIEIDTAIVARDMGNSSMLERLIQCLQVLHMERTKLPVDDLQLTLMIPKGKQFHALDPNYSNNQAHIAYSRGGFKHTQTVPIHNVDYPHVLHMREVRSNGVMLRLAKYTWLGAWLKYYNAISLVAKNDNEGQNQGTKIHRYRKTLFDVINVLAREPANHISRVFPRGVYINRLNDGISRAEEMTSSELPSVTRMRILLKTVLPFILKRVAETTRISFGLIMHLVSERLQKFSGQVTMFETTAELLQCIVIQLIDPCSNMRLFSGDLHTCQLHCTRCGKSFGVTDTLDVVLANAQIAILKHHGLCVLHWDKAPSEDCDVPIDGDETDLSCYDTIAAKLQFLFENVLPPIFASEKNLDEAMKQGKRNLEQDSKKRQASRPIARCDYGHHDSPRDKEARHRNFTHNLSFTEAVNMDAGYYLSDTTAYNSRVYATSAILGGLFQTSLDAYYLYQKLQVGESEQEEWDNYCDSAHQPEIAAEVASEINKLDKLEAVTYNGMKDFCELLDAVFKNNIALALSPAPHGAEMDDNFRSYLKSFFGISDQYKPHTFGDEIKMKILDIDVKVSRDMCFHARPVQRPVLDTFEQDQLGEGEGWNQPRARTWFEQNPAEKQVYGSSSVQKMAEDQIILRTMTHIKWTTDADGHKHYKFKCDNMKHFFSVYPSLKTKHKTLMSTEEFDCSQYFVKFFPFKVISVNRGRWIPIYKYLDPIRQRIKKARDECVGGLKSIRTQWGELPILEVYKKGQDEKAYNRVLVRGEELKNDLSQEPWAFNIIRRLSAVASHRMVVLGEGSRAKVGKEASEKPVYLDDLEDENSLDELIQESAPDFDSNHPTVLPVLENVWWCTENHKKLCVYGCIANMMHHLGAKESAQDFKSLVTLDSASLLRALDLPSFPRAVMSNINNKIDKLQLCLWLLRSRYNMDHSAPMVVEQFSTVTSIVDNLIHLKFPVILSMNITQTVYRHVICVWEGMIIDFEQKTTYPLTASNIEFSCGQYATFLNLHCGYGLFPSKVMKKHIKKEYGISNVGYSEYIDCPHYLFQQKKNRKRKRKCEGK